MCIKYIIIIVVIPNIALIVIIFTVLFKFSWSLSLPIYDIINAISIKLNE